jgi:hypothetical protein
VAVGYLVGVAVNAGFVAEETTIVAVGILARLGEQEIKTKTKSNEKERM